MIKASKVGGWKVLSNIKYAKDIYNLAFFCHSILPLHTVLVLHFFSEKVFFLEWTGFNTTVLDSQILQKCPPDFCIGTTDYAFTQFYVITML